MEKGDVIRVYNERTGETEKAKIVKTYHSMREEWADVVTENGEKIHSVTQKDRIQ